MTTEQKLRDYLKRATADLRQARRRLQELEESGSEPIAIVGMACRFPGGVRSPEEFWELVVNGRDAVAGFPADRGWDLATLQHADADRPGASYVRAGGFLYDAGEFDAGLFGIAPREALAMDPQQRLLLETAWESLERAGIAPDSVRGEQVGVFVGSLAPDYGPPMHAAPGEHEGYLLTGNQLSVASGRIAYSLGLEGPAVTIDTACSSSLVALHLAVQSLRRGECSMALAGGVTVMSQPGIFVDLGRQRGLAADGRCKAFAAGADGFGPAEGVGMLLVERLSDARRLGHQVLAVVRGSAVNQDGASNGLTAPNGPSQQRMIRRALLNAGLAAGEVDAVEAHGTGTPLGDPIEAQALLATYGQGREADRPLWLGSVKSNIGHTAAAAGVAGVIKMVLALRGGVLPRTLHVDEPTPHVDWSAGAVRLLTEAVDWPETGRPRRAGVSSFGISGTNAHVILEQATEVDDPSAVEVEPVVDAPVVPLVLSGRGEAALRAQLDRLAGVDEDLAAIGAALVRGRAVLEDRAVLLGEQRVVGHAAGDGGVVLVFPGQGSQWVGMASGLLASSHVFAESIAACSVALAPFTDWSLEEALTDAALLERVDVVQPVLFSVMVSLAALWRSLGVEVSAVVGHSQGEIAAACVAGALSLDDAARVVALRAKSLARVAGSGGMVSLFASAAKAGELLVDFEGRVGIAAVNGPGSVVVSGEAAALDEFMVVCADAGVDARRVNVDYASHSAQMELLEAEILQALAPVTGLAPSIPMLSTYTGEWVRPGELGARYWYENLRHPVHLQVAVAELAKAGHRVFVESSPHPVLTVGVQETLDENGGGVALGTLRREQGGPERLLTSLAEAFVNGATVDWTRVLTSTAHVDLPTYPFQRERYWLDGTAATTAVTTAVAAAEADAVDSEFWRAVESGDLAAFTESLGVAGDQSISTLLPALSDWRRGRRDSAVLDSWRYRIGWQPTAEPTGTRLTGRWLLVLPRDGAAGELPAIVADALSAAGATVLTVAAGEAATDRAALAQLLCEAGPADAVLSLLALDAAPAIGAPHLLTGVAATLVLLQALGDAGVDAPLWCATRGAVSVGGGEAATAPAQQQVWGLGRTAALEYPDRWGGLVDLPPVLDARAAARLCAVLAQEDEDQVAIRATGLFLRRLERAPLADTPPVRGWRPRGTVLLTGGTGAIGPHLVRWLAGGGAEHLVLTTRRPADSPDFDELRTQTEALGARLTIANCDTGDRAELAALIERVEAQGPEIRAVVHAAAFIKLGPLGGVSLQEFDDTMASKSGTADYLDELLDRDSVDAFVLFSSVAGLWGSGDHGTYAAGNAYLDAVAERRRARGRSALSIAWGVWDGCTPAGVDPERPARHGLPTIAPRLALLGMQQALDHDETTVALAEVDWARFGPIFTSARPRPLLAGIPEARPARAQAAQATTTGRAQAAPAAAEALRQRLSGLSAPEQQKVLLDLVVTEAAAVLGHRAPGGVRPDRAFRESGTDSLTSVELRDRVAAATGLRLPAALVFSHPTPQALARHLLTLLLGDAAATPAATAGGTAHPATATGTSTATGTATDGEPLAIVGMACRLPGGVGSPEDLWRLVDGGGDAIAGLPGDRGWDLGALYDPDPDRDGTSYVRHGGFLYDAGEFDAGFFGISPREAQMMDPQQRLLLETSWEAVERAGIDPTSLRGTRAGVFVGINYQDYGTGLSALPAGSEGHLLTGSVSSVASGRVAYTMGLEGPAITLDTACSSSLVALHLAGQSLNRGECTMALVGGVAVMYNPRTLVAFSRQRGLAKDGRCKAFAAGADGMGLAEGVGMLLVERLSDARRLGHQVLAVVRASAINQDGASNGLAAPSGPAQERVIRQALANAGLSTGDVDAVEAHGTGTSLGDPIEAEALLATYGQCREADRPLLLGSLKSNIGHTQAASGVASVIKTVMALRHGVLPQTLHVDAPSSHVDWSAGGVELLRERTSWPRTGRVRRAGVSSFGISGTNAHVILEQAEPSDAPSITEPAAPVLDTPLVPLVLSGKGGAALRAQIERFAAFEGSNAGDLAAEGDLAPVGAALVRGRALFEDRAVLLGEQRVVGRAAGDGGVVLVFPGQGSQWVGMASGLLASSHVFAESIAACSAALAPFTDWSLEEALTDAALLERVDVVQPVLFSVMVSLAALWRSLGVEVSAVVGHSQGEIAAACVAGALSLEDAARVVALRAKSLARVAGSGGMVSLFASAAKAGELLVGFEGRVGVAAVNGPGSVVVSGEAAALDEFMVACSDAGVDARRVNVDYASHSAQMELLEEEILQALAPVTGLAPSIPMLSTYTGEWVRPGELGGRYWYENLRHPVRLQEAVAELAKAGHRVFVESSPHPVLTVGVQGTLDENGGGVALGTLRREQGGPERLLTSLAEAFVNGATVDWTRLLTSTAHVDLPTYPFQHEHYWLLDAAGPAAPAATGTAADGEFWRAVESGELAATLGLDPARPLGEALPAIAAWRREREAAASIADWRYRVDWRPVADPAGPARLAGTWLVVASPAVDSALVQDCAVALGKAGAEVVERSIAVTDADPEHYLDLLRTAGQVDGVLSLLGLDTEPSAQAPAVPRGLAGSLALVQALGTAECAAPLWLATRGAVSTEPGAESTDLAQAQLWGLGRVIGLEHPERWGGLVDLPSAAGPWDERWAERLGAVLAGLPCDGGTEDQVAIRPAGLHVRRLNRAPRPSAAGTPWRPHGTVLVTGGTGAIGGHVARWLAGAGAEHLVLVSRSGPAAPGADALRAELEQLGARVTVAACEVADRAALTALAAAVEAQGEPIRAVFHAAGAGWTATLAETDRALLADSATAKVTATLAIEAVLGDRLEAFVLFSSNAAVWGSTGLGAYAAANAFLDAFAEDRARRGLPVTSVAWGLWEGPGMAEGAATERMLRRGLRAMAPEHAVAALRQALEQGEALLAVADLDWPRFHAAFAAARPRPLVADLAEVRRLLDAPAEAPEGAVDEGAAYLAALAATPPAERLRALVELVRTHAAAVLRFDAPGAVPAERAFRELGFDSITAVEVRTRLGAATGLRLPATLIFDHPTPQLLAQHLAELLFPGSAQAAAEDPADTALRELLASIPPHRLREAGLDQALLRLAADPHAPSAEPAAEPAADAPDIDALDTESLIRLALAPSDS
ncbi:type I polyketide synthase [Kitasatospora sp. NBC_01287]|uniref:type I polyketide synthase n=1 Tax=Kitasatospora sp. NBC_01287 TaxID=2903573 RepID=UPI002B1CFD67|nr:SDR family NAD(P)-dependent oxidoreductase [Kitasatospora sp. NBC_01287]